MPEQLKNLSVVVIPYSNDVLPDGTTSMEIIMKELTHILKEDDWQIKEIFHNEKAEKLIIILTNLL